MKTNRTIERKNPLPELQLNKYFSYAHSLKVVTTITIKLKDADAVHFKEK